MKSGDYGFYRTIGICPHCGKRPSEPNRSLCYECLGYEQDRYHERKESGKLNEKLRRSNEQKMKEYNRRKVGGLCTRCGKKPAAKGLLCARCYGRYRSRQIAKKSDIDRSERPVYDLCYICGKGPLLEGKRVCAKCYEVRMRTMTSAWEKQDKSYFQGLNDLHFAKKA